MGLVVTQNACALVRMEACERRTSKVFRVLCMARQSHPLRIPARRQCLKVSGAGV